jgi:hypothetical protein
VGNALSIATGRLQQLAVTLLAATLLTIVAAPSARASQLLTMAAGAADLALNGTAIPEPLSPMGALRRDLEADAPLVARGGCTHAGARVARWQRRPSRRAAP